MSNDIEFTLIPCELPKSNSTINISGNIIRTDNKLSLAYFLQGNLSTIIIPEPSNLPTRKNELWQTTCFEFFIGIANSTEYWEFNLSPTGDWNVYRFSDYRCQMQEETAFATLPFTLNKQKNSLAINLEIDVNLIINSNTNLEIAITTVIESSKGEISYWALHHPETIANFHNRNGFILHV